MDKQHHSGRMPTDSARWIPEPPNRPTLPTGTTEHRSRRGVTTAGVLIGVVVLAGCTNNEPPSQPPPTSAPSAATPTAATVDPMAAEADRQARAAYVGYLQAYARAAQAADPDDPALARYLADPLLATTRRNVRKLKAMGAVQVGAQKADVVRSQIDLTAKPPTVVIYSCLDFSDLKVVYKASRSPVPDFVIAKTRAPAVVTVWQYETGQWLVNATKQGGHSC